MSITLQRRLISIATLLIQYILSILPLIVRRLVFFRFNSKPAASTALLADPVDAWTDLELNTLRRNAARVADCMSRACVGLQIEEVCIKWIQKVIWVANEGGVGRRALEARIEKRFCVANHAVAALWEESEVEEAIEAIVVMKLWILKLMR